MQPTSDEWRSYYRAGAERRKKRGGDYIIRHQQRMLARDRLAMAAASGGLVALFVVSYVLLTLR
ncbi:MAG: hypothetical protein JWM82_2303 [Myxococcales bacterium]|nr:hypothetical protein [Myxococcales bacterium]